MKISLRWLFDHIDGSWQSCDVPFLVKRFIESVAEIEGVHELSLDQGCFALGQVTAALDQEIHINIPEWHIDAVLSPREHARVGDRYLVVRDSSGASLRWASLIDLGSEKDGLVPSLYVQDSDMSGEWKKSIAWSDTILSIDNKSITHRPDMWGHRGFAREVAALLNLPLKSFEALSTHLEKKERAQEGVHSVIHAAACSRFATLQVSHASYRPSLVSVAFMLARVDARPIDALVDGTNYVMLDTGQPLHAFDTALIKGGVLGPRFARAGEVLTLLDGQKITLTPEDLVIADEKSPLALAGIMGGIESGVSRTTTSMVIEAAAFDAATIRRSASRYKLRTEASARFEKTLDPQGNVAALERYAYLCKAWQLPMAIASWCGSLGVDSAPGLIEISHNKIESQLGCELSSEQVVHILEPLEFKVYLHAVEGDTVYRITVPTFRSTKDVRIQEDIIEEIGRSLGYTSLTPSVPFLPATVKNTHATNRIRHIKQVMSTGLSMREIYSYGLCDEAWLQELGWEPQAAVVIKNPLSQQWRRTITTLVPALLKAVQENQVTHDQLRFFEWARIWRMNADIEEKKSLAAIMYDKTGKLSFYEAKFQLQKLFDALALPVSYVRIHEPVFPWYMPYQSAHIVVGEGIIGTFGMLHPSYQQKMGEGSAALFECDGDFLLSYKAPIKRFVPLSKYPSAARDVSLLVPLALESARIKDVLKKVDTRITHVELVDFFEKESWADKRSLTFRYIMQDPQKTLTKEEMETIEQAVLSSLKALGAEIR